MDTKQKSMLGRIVLAALLLMAAFLLKLDGFAGFLSHLLPYLVVGWDVLYKAARNIARGQVFDENFLMALATIGAMAIQEYPEAVAVLLFYQVGELFQSYAVGKSRRSIAELMDIRPDYANLERGGGLEQVDPDEVAVGDIIVIKPGERVPLDGTVVEGSSSLNTAALTGESIPRDVDPGSDVISGCVNLSGLLRVCVTKRSDESTVSRILELVENASDKKASAENFIARFARYYTPVVVGAAALLCILPTLLLGQDFGEWLHRALILLVISCPCALVISIPLSFFGGIGGASRHGILVKGGNYLEVLSRAETFVFDKTGTLTRGSFRVAAVCPEGISESELLEVSALAESFSSHPIAVSLREAYGSPLDAGRVCRVQENAGHGVSAEVDGREVFVGNEKWMRRHQVAYAACDQPGTILHTAQGGNYTGHIVIADSVKPEAKQVLQQLRDLGVRRHVMLTGDSPEVARAVAEELGIDEFHAALLPEDKVRHIERLLGEKGRKRALCFVGDGINDAPVLSLADVGIAMGALGSDAAIEAADIVLMNDRLEGLPRAVAIAKKTVRIANQNIAFALGVKALFLGLGALGMANLWEAVFADVGVTVIAILNAMRALRISSKN